MAKDAFDRETALAAVRQWYDVSTEAYRSNVGIARVRFEDGETHAAADFRVQAERAAARGRLRGLTNEIIAVAGTLGVGRQALFNLAGNLDCATDAAKDAAWAAVKDVEATLLAVGATTIAPVADAPIDTAAESHQPPAKQANALGPRWDKARGVLYLDEVEIKTIRTNQAPNVVKVLAAFEEEGWPNEILDPLPHADEEKRKKRRRDTVESLNDGLTGIRFSAVGNGNGIGWQRDSA